MSWTAKFFGAKIGLILLSVRSQFNF